MRANWITHNGCCFRYGATLIDKMLFCRPHLENKIPKFRLPTNQFDTLNRLPGVTNEYIPCSSSSLYSYHLQAPPFVSLSQPFYHNFAVYNVKEGNIRAFQYGRNRKHAKKFSLKCFLILPKQGYEAGSTTFIRRQNWIFSNSCVCKSPFSSLFWYY